MRRTPALILGGGPAGSAAAIQLARGGIAAHLIERSSGPRDIVCGAFLGWDALAALERLGLDPEALGARRIDRLRLVSASATAEARLPRLAAGLSRRILDETLLKAAAEVGATVTRGVSIRSADAAELRVQLDGGTVIEADALFLSTGKHELRGLARPRAAAFDHPVVGLRAQMKASPALLQALTGYVELHLFEGGYAGLLVQEDDSVNLCLSVAADRLKQAGNVEALLKDLGRESPRLGERLAHAPEASRWEAIAGVPYGWRARTTSPGLFRVGDQAAVIASLAGDGVAIALTSGIEAASAYLAQGPGGAASYQRSFAARAARPLMIAGLLRSAAENETFRPVLLALARTAPGLAALAARLTRV
jgi:flavin-dependent dehydrogenase